ncbi:unnamed protein product [Camellia sinensis]
MADSSSWYAKLSRAIVGWFRYNVIFRKAVVFMADHSLVDRGVVGILISYLEENWEKENLAKVASVTNVQDRLSAVMMIVIAHISDTWTGHFMMVVYSTVAYVIVIKCKSQTKKVKPTRSPITNVYYVTKAAIWKRNLDYPATSKQFYHNDKGELTFASCCTTQ